MNKKDDKKCPLCMTIYDSKTTAQKSSRDQNKRLQNMSC